MADDPCCLLPTTRPPRLPTGQTQSQRPTLTTAAQAKDLGWDKGALSRSPQVPQSPLPPRCHPARGRTEEKGLTWGMIKSSLMYMSCSTPADLREKGRRCGQVEAARQGNPAGNGGSPECSEAGCRVW